MSASSFLPFGKWTPPSLCKLFDKMSSQRVVSRAVTFVKVAVVEEEEELAAVSFQSLERVGEAGGEVPDVAIRDVVLESATPVINGGDPRRVAEAPRQGGSCMDYSFVTGRLATGGGITTDQDVQALVKAGVTHIIDCRLDFDDSVLLRTHPSLSYLWNGTADDGQPKPPEWFGKSIAFALDALSHPKANVYVHCKAGVNRGPSTTYAILRAFGMAGQLAESLIRKARPQVGLAYKNDANKAVAILGYT